MSVVEQLEVMDVQLGILMQSMLHMQQVVAESDAAIVHTILNDREEERRRRKEMVGAAVAGC